FLEASARVLGSGTDYVKAGVEGVYLRPYFDDRLVLVAHALFEALSGDKDVPFEVLPRLGGESTLRGFSPNRFFGDGRVLFNAEARARVLRLHLFGVDTQVEVAPFVDVGKVYNSVGQLFSGSVEVTPGVGFRGISPPNVVGHIELGWSREGPAIFVGLDYPF
ncbi:MAG: hypothetical protein DMD79_21175, partial [Candidatus Rokuibacteriota bacterium]